MSILYALVCLMVGVMIGYILACWTLFMGRMDREDERQRADFLEKNR